MISIQQWRSSIGPFCGGRHTNSNSVSVSVIYTRESSETRYLKDMCARLFIMSFVMWGFYVQICVVSAFQQLDVNNIIERLCSHIVTHHQHTPLHPHMNLLMLCGDIESNPGPSIEEQFELLNNNLNEKFNALNNTLNTEIKKLTVGFENLKASLDDVTSSVSKLKDDVNTLKDQFSTIQDKHDNIQLDVVSNAVSISSVEERLSILENAIEKQEQNSRRENVILHGVPERENENVDNARKRVCDLFNANVKSKHWLEVDLLRAHRLGGKRQDNSNRPLIVRFIHFYDKLKVMRAKPDFKKLGIRVNDDLTKNQRDELNKLRNRGLKGYYRGGKLVVDQNSSGPPPSGAEGMEVSDNRRPLTALRKLPGTHPSGSRS